MTTIKELHNSLQIIIHEAWGKNEFDYIIFTCTEKNHIESIL